MIELLPNPVHVLGYQKPGGVQYIALASLDQMLCQMQLNNAKHPQGRYEYDEALQAVRDTLNRIPWSKPE